MSFIINEYFTPRGFQTARRFLRMAVLPPILHRFYKPKILNLTLTLYHISVNNEKENENEIS